MSQIQVLGSCQTAGPIAPNLAHICRSIWEWIYAKQIAPRDTRGGGHLGGFRGQTLKSWEAVKRLDQLAPTLVYVCGFIWECRPSIPQGAMGVGGHTFKSLGKLLDGYTDWQQTWYNTPADSSGNGHRLNTIHHTIPHGHLGGGGV